MRLQSCQKHKISSPKLPEIVSRVPEIVVRAPQGRSLAPGGRPGGSQPPSRGARGRYPGPSKSYVFISGKLTFPLSAPHRRQAPQSTARHSNSNSLVTSAPRAITVFYPSILTFRTLSFRSPGWQAYPHAGPRGVGGLTGLRPLPPPPKK